MHHPLTKCRVCYTADLEPVLDLGIQAMTGIFPKDAGDDYALERGPLALVRCAECGLVQLSVTYDLKEMYGDNYGYRSGLNASMVRHLESKAWDLQVMRPLKVNDVVLDIGSNDGTFLNFFPKNAARIGFDPTVAKFSKYYDLSVQRFPEFFSAEMFRARIGLRKAKIVTSISMFYDLPDPVSFADDVASVLADDGIWHLEQSYLPAMLDAGSYDTVCHEHLEYYGLKQLKAILGGAGLKILDVQFNGVNGGSFAVTAGRGEESPELPWLLHNEEMSTTKAAWSYFRDRAKRHRDELPVRLHELKNQGRRVLGRGASTKGNVLLQYCGIGPDLLPAIAEVNPDKFGHLTPGSRIPIISEDAPMAKAAEVFMVLPWHFRQSFMMRATTPLLFPLPEIALI